VWVKDLLLKLSFDPKAQMKRAGEGAGVIWINQRIELVKAQDAEIELKEHKHRGSGQAEGRPGEDAEKYFRLPVLKRKVNKAQQAVRSAFAIANDPMQGVAFPEQGNKLAFENFSQTLIRDRQFGRLAMELPHEAFVLPGFAQESQIGGTAS